MVEPEQPRYSKGMLANIKDLKFSKHCKHCKYMKKHQGYTYRLFNSKYFDKSNVESLPEVIRAFNCDINLNTIYTCLKKHFPEYSNKPQVRVNEQGVLVVDNRYAVTESIVEAPKEGVTNHELGLDEFIQRGREALARGEIAITAANYIAAIKVKAEIEKSTKDRRLDMLKSMFAGASPERKT